MERPVYQSRGPLTKRTLVNIGVYAGFGNLRGSGGGEDGWM